MYVGIWLTQNQDSYTQKCTAFIPLGPMLMQMSTGLAFGPVAHAHCHFCIRSHDVYLIMHSLHSPLIPDHNWQGRVGNLQCVLLHKGGSEVSPFYAACRPGIAIYPVSSEVSSSVPPDGMAFFRGCMS